VPDGFPRQVVLTGHIDLPHRGMVREQGVALCVGEHRNAEGVDRLRRQARGLNAAFGRSEPLQLALHRQLLAWNGETLVLAGLIPDDAGADRYARQRIEPDHLRRRDVVVGHPGVGADQRPAPGLAAVVKRQYRVAAFQLRERRCRRRRCRGGRQAVALDAACLSVGGCQVPPPGVEFRLPRCVIAKAREKSVRPQIREAFDAPRRGWCDASVGDQGIHRLELRQTSADRRGWRRRRRRHGPHASADHQDGKRCRQDSAASGEDS
jgi:hypothetical protein